jgi:hypothetical protein
MAQAGSPVCWLVLGQHLLQHVSSTLLGQQQYSDPLAHSSWQQSVTAAAFVCRQAGGAHTYAQHAVFHRQTPCIVLGLICGSAFRTRGCSVPVVAQVCNQQSVPLFDSVCSLLPHLCVAATTRPCSRASHTPSQSPTSRSVRSRQSDGSTPSPHTLQQRSKQQLLCPVTRADAAVQLPCAQWAPQRHE